MKLYLSIIMKTSIFPALPLTLGASVETFTPNLWRKTEFFFVFVSLQPLRCRCVKSVIAGGQYCHWSVFDGPGHAQHLHHGLQGDEQLTCHVLMLYQIFTSFRLVFVTDAAVLGPRPQSSHEEGLWGSPLLPAHQSVRNSPEAGLHNTAYLHLQGVMNL